MDPKSNLGDRETSCSHCDKIFPSHEALIRHLYYEIGTTDNLAREKSTQSSKPQNNARTKNIKKNYMLSKTKQGQEQPAKALHKKLLESNNRKESTIRKTEEIEYNHNNVQSSIDASFARNVITENRNKLKRKGSIKGSISKKKTSKCSDETSFTSDTSHSDESVKLHSRKVKPKKKKRSDSVKERSTLDSSDTDSDDILRKMVKLMKERKKKSLKKLLKLSKHKKLKKKPKVKIYKCQKCLIHFMDKINLRKHLHRGDHVDKKKRCVICKLKFSKKSIARHVKKHHMKVNLQVKDFNIVTELSSSESSDTDSSSTDSDDDTLPRSKERQPEPSTLATANDDDTLSYSDEHEPEPSTSSEHQVQVVNNEMKAESFHRNTDEPFALPDTTQDLQVPFLHRMTNQLLQVNSNKNSDSDSNDDQFEVNSDMNYEDTERLTSCSDDDHNLQIASKDKATVQTRSVKTKQPNTKSDSRHTIHKCDVCDTCFLNPITFKAHMDVGKHDLKTKTQCPICDLFFSGISLKKHIRLHHTITPHLNIPDKIYIANNQCMDSKLEVNSEMNQADPEIHISCSDDDQQLQKVSRNETRATKTSDKTTQINTGDSQHKIHKCDVCDTCFLNRDALKRHMFVGKHDLITRTQCRKCNLFFSGASLKKHVQYYHKKLTYSEIPGTMFSKTIYKCRTCKVYFLTSPSLNQHLLKNNGTDHKNGRVTRCKICKLLFTKKAMPKHLKFHHEMLKFDSENDFDVITLPSENEVTVKKNIIYKCRICEVHFLTKHNNKFHVKGLCRKQRMTGIDACSRCNLLFTKMSMAKHLKLHHETLKLMSQNDFDIKILPSEISVKEIAKRLKQPIFKCRLCKVHFLTKNSLKVHLYANRAGHKKRRATRCKICKLLFAKLAMRIHVKFHHGALKLKTANDFYVNIMPRQDHLLLTQSVIRTSVVENGAQCIDIKLEVNSEMNQADTGTHISCSNDDQQLQKVSRNETTATKKLDKTKQINTGDSQHKIHKCDVCDTCFLNRNALECHMSVGKHDLKTRTQCRKCNLFFSGASLKKHVRYYHKKLTYSEIPGTMFSKTIYKCRTCKVYFLTSPSLNQHLLKNNGIGHKNGRVTRCKICKLLFTKMAMPKHLKLHHEMLKLYSENDFDVITLPSENGVTVKKNIIYKCRKCELHFLNVNAIRLHLQKPCKTQHGPRTDACSICNLLFSKVSIPTHLNLHHKQLNLKTRNDFDIKILPSEISVEEDAERFSKTIYKCRICEVYFLTRLSLTHHFLRNGTGHKNGRVTRCKICKLLFTKVAMRIHVKFHHETLKLKTENDFHVNIMPRQDHLLLTQSVMGTSVDENGAEACYPYSNQPLNISKEFQLKECVVKLTDILQSALVSTTSNGTFKLKQRTQQLPDYKQNVLNFTTDSHEIHNDKDGDNIKVSGALDTEHGSQTLNTDSLSKTSHNHQNTVVVSMDADENKSLNMHDNCVKIEADEFDGNEIDSNYALSNSVDIDQNQNKIFSDDENQQKLSIVQNTSPMSHPKENTIGDGDSINVSQISTIRNVFRTDDNNHFKLENPASVILNGQVDSLTSNNIILNEKQQYDHNYAFIFDHNYV